MTKNNGCYKIYSHSQDCFFPVVVQPRNVTNLAISNTVPIIIIGQNEPGKICAKPITE